MIEGATAPLTVERTHLQRNDLDWLPSRFKALRWGVAGTIWAGIAGTLAVMVPFAKGIYIYWGKGLAALVAGGYYAGDRTARWMLRRRLHKLAHGVTNLGTFSRDADGELRFLRGRVRARRTVPSFVDGEAVAFRRVLFRVGEIRFVHEAAVDFSLVDDTGESVTVLAEGARLLAPEPKHWRVLPSDQLERVRELDLPPATATVVDKMLARRAKGKRIGEVKLKEIVVRDGDPVELVGYKTRVVDPSVATLERETPMRATLRSGRDLPLLIAPGRDQPPPSLPPSPGAPPSTGT